jgi:integrase
VNVIAIRKPKTESKSKVVDANQNSIDALPLNSGTWRVHGVPGLYLRCRAKAKSFMLQRRVDGDLVKETLGVLTMKTAKDLTMKRWSAMKPKPAKNGALTLETAVEQYIEAKTAAKKLAPKTQEIHRYNASRYLAKWKDRSLGDVGKDRAGIRLLQQQITKLHGRSTSNQVIRLLSAVYRWCRDVDEELPEFPRKAAEIHHIDARDWAYSPEELRAWWQSEAEKAAQKVKQGVSTLGPLKRTWWLTALFTGARKGSIEALKWSDIDLDKKVIRFAVAKGNRVYSIPMADVLAELLIRYRDSGEVPPSQWVFPSPVIDGAHLVDVKNINEGIGPAHRLRHTFRTTLAEIGAAPDQARLLLGHSLGGDVSRGYISAPLLVESLRPITNAVAEKYLKILGRVVK